MTIIIESQNVGKKYTLGSRREPYYALRDSIAGIFSGRNDRSAKKDFYALKNINFQIQQGEAVGIIGRNGAGKSTLLKILSQITPPTYGKITIRGRVASLLEVGTGFHPELTGRENIYLNGAILGMTRREIRKKFNSIVEFAEIEKFIDTPVKRYSSGMYVRLAFAVAAHLEPEILIIDEILAVGDVQFQKKCLGRMQDVAKSGRTILFVSHNLGAINQLCQRTLLLKKGELVADGKPADVIKDYLNSELQENAVYKQKSNKNKSINLRKVILNPDTHQHGTSVPYDEDITIRVEYEVNKKISNCLVWIQLQTIDGMNLLCSADYDLHPRLRHERRPGYYKADLVIPKKWLNVNTYGVTVGINTNDAIVEVFDYVDTIKFDIIDNGTTPKSTFSEAARSGILQPYLDWKTSKI